MIRFRSNAAQLTTYANAYCLAVTPLKTIKSIQSVEFHDIHQGRITDKTVHTANLTDSLSPALHPRPHAQVVCAHRYGLYVWGQVWRDVKRPTKCFAPLFDVTLRMRNFGSERGAAPNEDAAQALP